MPFQKGRAKTGGKKKGTLNGQTLRSLAGLSGHITATVERVLEEYGHIAFLDIREAFTEAGDLKSIEDFPDTLARSVAGIEFEEVFERRGDQRAHVGRIHKIKLLNKINALDSLGKHLGIFAADKSADGGGDTTFVVNVHTIPAPKSATEVTAVTTRLIGGLNRS